jgi:hypothetical protein
MEELSIKLVNWIERCKQGTVLLRVIAISKQKTKFNLKLSFKAGANCNAKLPYTFLKESFAEVETKCIGHFMKIDPSKAWGDIEVIVDV